MLTTGMKEDIEYLLSKGLRIDSLFKMEVMMGEVLGALPEVSAITILNREEKPLYTANRKGVVNFTNDTGQPDANALQNLSNTEGEYNLLINVVQDGQIVGYISTNISREVVRSKLLETVYDSLTVLAISVFFFVELLILVFQFFEKQVTETTGKIRVHYKAIRPAAFLFLFGIDISISFLPLHMGKLYEPIFGLSKNIMIWIRKE